MAGAVEDSHGVGKEVCDGIKGFDGTFGTPGKIDDEGVMANDGDAAGEDGGGSFFGTLATEFFGKARDGPLGDIESGFGSIVPRAKPGATGGENEVNAAGVSEFAELATKTGGIVRTAEGRSNFPAQFACTFDQGGAGEVFAFTARDGIADGEDGDTHGWRLFYRENRR
jgi:hypothetical protein